MKVLLIFSYAPKLGSGHLKRMEVLAAELRRRGHDARTVADSDIDMLRDLKPDVVVLDIFGLDAALVKKVRAMSPKSLIAAIITSNIFRSVSADITLNASARLPNAVADSPVDGGTIITGPHYNLMGSEYELAHAAQKTISENIHKICVCMGGEDPRDNTAKAIRKIMRSKLRDCDVTVVLGRRFIHKLPATPKNFKFKRDLQTLAAEFMRADLAIVAGGIVAYESSCAGTPFVVVPKDALERENMKAFRAAGACLIGLSKINSLIPKSVRENMSAAGKEFVKPLGTKTLADKICGLVEARKK